MCDNKNDNSLKKITKNIGGLIYNITPILDKNNKLKKKDDMYLYDLI